MKILITDIELRKTFDVYNSLKIYYGDINLLLGVNNVKCKMFSKIQYQSEVINLRTIDYVCFESDLKIILEKYKNEAIVYIPIEESTTLLFYKFIENNNFSNLKYTLPSYEVFLLSRNKYLLNDYCFKNNINSPKIYNGNIDELINLEKKIVLKPRIGSGSQGIEYFDNGNQLLEKLNRFDLNNYLVQEYIEHNGDVEGGFFLCQNGELISYYSHRRIRTSPPSGGVTVLSEISLNNIIKDEGMKLLSKLNWNGIVMIEYLRDLHGEYKVIEMNPRVWGSILLSEFSGVNILKNYINISLGIKPIDENIKLNTRIRWFFPMDLIGYFKSCFRIYDFWKFDNNTCYINFTYSTIFRTILFLLINGFNFAKLKKIFR